MSYEGFTCPICRGSLKLKENTLLCKKGHAYDLAKEGYTYLLPVQKKHAKDPGDNKEMVDARARFLDSGAYGLFADTLADMVVKIAARCKKPVKILDMGCGEGYYSRAVADKLIEKNIPYEILGMDIAKPAVKRAAKLAPPNAFYAVGSCFSCPIEDNWADIIINIFAPLAESEILRILKKDGHFIYAVPGAKHLFGLKEVLYENPYENKVQDISYKGLETLEPKEALGEIKVEGKAIEDLFCMTPYYWKTPKEGSEKLSKLESLSTPIHFRFLHFKKK